MEYAAPVWHTNLTSESTSVLESVQKRVLKIIFPNLDYTSALAHSKLSTLHYRREQLCKDFFSKIRTNHKFADIVPPTTCKHYNLRHDTLEQPLCKTNRYKNSLIPYALFNFQK